MDNEESGVEEVATLAGPESAGTLRPYIAELEAVGAAEVKDIAERGQIITVNGTPIMPGG
ncbi:hypothetical protein [Streptomyces sp. NPDC092295]|uniref:hypothetical protein n=1 Tax=Streptomyces sp. NPDC092295 TaxID=3366011 RepID=UPI0037F5BFDB